jgi:hypothetical protein
VLEALNLGLYAIAADRLLEYDEAGGIIRSGLEMRRGRERALFLLGCAPRGALVLNPMTTAIDVRAVLTRAQAAAIETAREDAETDALNQAELDRIAQGTSIG